MRVGQQTHAIQIKDFVARPRAATTPMLRESLHHVADLLADMFEQQTVANANVQSDVCPAPLLVASEPANDYATPEEYARRRSVGRSTVFSWIRAGLPSTKQGATRRIRVRD